METDDFRVRRTDDQQQIGQRITIKRDDGEVLKDLQSMDTFPVPSVGDRLMLSTKELITDEQQGVVFDEDTTTDPPDESELYVVDGVGYEYASVEPSEELSDQYEAGFSVVISILVSKSSSSL